MDILGYIKLLGVIMAYSALTSFLFPIKYNFVKKYTKRGGIMDADIDFVNTFIIHMISLLLFFIMYGLFIKKLIFGVVY